MIQSLVLKNFQAHQDTKLEFSPGVNCLVGSSDNGKSSIIRSILWAYTNRPLGEAFVSYWNRTKKDTIAGETSVLLSFTEGELLRIKTPDRNGYTIKGLELGAIGTEVPKEATELFNITDLNISSQHDKPFLLSESAGDVAKYLNKLVKLDKIDDVLSKSESKKREVRKELESAENELGSVQKSLVAYSWLENAKTLYATMVSIRDTIKKAAGEQEALQMRLDEVYKAKEALEQASKNEALIKKASRLIREIEVADEEYRELCKEQDIDGLARAINAVKENKKKLEECINIPDSLIKNIEGVYMKIEETNAKITSLRQIVEIAEKSKATVAELEKKIKEYIDTLPDMCPSCGRLMGEDKC